MARVGMSVLAVGRFSESREGGRRGVCLVPQCMCLLAALETSDEMQTLYIEFM